MRSSKIISLFGLLGMAILIGACGSAAPTLSDADRISTRVAEDRAVAGTLTAEAIPAVTDTPVPTTYTAAPTSTAAPTNSPAAATPTYTVAPLPTAAPPTPTQIVIGVLPIDGGGGEARSIYPANNNQNVVLPGFSQAEVQRPMIFRDRINMSVALVQEPQSVTFEISDNDAESGNPVYAITDGSAPFCLFDVNATQCPVLTYAQNGYRWPNGSPIYNGANYTVQITIQETGDNQSNWNFNFAIQGAQDRPVTGGTDFGGRWLTNFATVDLQQSGAQVSGTYVWYGGQQAISIQGVVSGSTLSGFFAGDASKTFTFTLDQSGQSFDGNWGGQYQWCGVRSGPLPDGCGFSGFWESMGDYAPDYPPTMQVTQIGNQIQGTFQNGIFEAPGTFQGTIGPAGHYTAVGTWNIDRFSGQFRWTLVDYNSQQMQGYSVNADGSQHQWCSWRSGLSQPTPCFGE